MNVDDRDTLVKRIRELEDTIDDRDVPDVWHEDHLEREYRRIDHADREVRMNAACLLLPHLPAGSVRPPHLPALRQYAVCAENGVPMDAHSGGSPIPPLASDHQRRVRRFP